MNCPFITLKKALNAFIFIIGTCIFFSNTNGFAHGSLTIRIQEKTQEISKDSLNSELYFERGFLYQQHYEYEKAISDFIKSENLGYTQDILHFRKAETYLFNKNPHKALESINFIFNENTFDVKIYKLRAQIFHTLKEHYKAIESYEYVLEYMVDIRPSDIIEYSKIILAQNPANYDDALVVIESGLEKLGEKTLTLNLKKLEYLKALNNHEKIIEQYNFFIVNSKRKENWYFKKAIYLNSIGKDADSNIALQQAKMSIVFLKPKTQNTIAIKRLLVQIDELEKTLIL